MTTALERKILDEFKKRVDDGELREDLQVTYRVSGGAPSKWREEEVRLTGSGRQSARVDDDLQPAAAAKARGKLGKDETLGLMRQIVAGLDGLIPRSEARFVPDSVIGSVSIELGGEQADFFFLADEDERLAAKQALAPELTTLIRTMKKVSDRALKKPHGKQKSRSRR